MTRIEGQPPSALSLLGKSLLFYVLLVLVMRVMGKREIASLSPLDLVVTIMIADAAIIAIEEDRYPIWAGSWKRSCAPCASTWTSS